VGSLDAPQLYGAGLLSSLGEAEHCLTSAVRKVPLTVACADQPYDITRMQPQLFVARDFEQLNDVLAEFKRGMAWQRGGDYGLDEALRSRSVNHLVLDEAGTPLALTGTVERLHRFGAHTGPELTTALVEVAGPVMINSQKPTRGSAMVLIGEARLPAKGRFALKLASGLVASGFVVAGHEVISLEVKQAGQRLDVPTWGQVIIAKRVTSAAGGPSDPHVWDKAFGTLDSFATGEAEAEARQRKADALPQALADAYREVNVMHRTGRADAARIEQFKMQWPDEALLLEEIERL
jgi:phenylalanine-4-hydroxylase